MFCFVCRNRIHDVVEFNGKVRTIKGWQRKLFDELYPITCVVSKSVVCLL